jgi:hypothetical protein
MNRCSSTGFGQPVKLFNSMLNTNSVTLGGGLLIRLTACFLGRLTAACLSALLRLPAPLLCGLLIRLTACFLSRLTAACLSALLRLPAPLLCGLLIRLTACLFDQAYCRLFVSLTVTFQALHKSQYLILCKLPATLVVFTNVTNEKKKI